MEEQIVEVQIFSDGYVVIDVKGVKGPNCLSITKSLENALGGATDENRAVKPEIYQETDSKERTNDLRF
jgi:Protein of unknown function (DUF2997)